MSQAARITVLLWVGLVSAVWAAEGCDVSPVPVPTTEEPGKGGGDFHLPAPGGDGVTESTSQEGGAPAGAEADDASATDAIDSCLDSSDSDQLKSDAKNEAKPGNMNCNETSRERQ
jgi:hypothetical protein